MLPPGLQQSAATFSVTYNCAERGFPGIDLSLAFLAAGGTTHKPSDVSVVGPDELSNENGVFWSVRNLDISIKQTRYTLMGMLPEGRHVCG